MMVAAQYDSVRAAKLLMEAGADINAWTSNRMTPLMIATYANSLGMIALLKKAGAIMNIPGAITSVKTLAISIDDLDRMTEELMARAQKEREQKNRIAIEIYTFGQANIGVSEGELLDAYFDKVLADLASDDDEIKNRAIVHLYSQNYRLVIDKLAFSLPNSGAYSNIYRFLDEYILAVSTFEFAISNPMKVRTVLDFKIRDLRKSIRTYRGLK